jgi:hypothetical protein
VSEEAIELALDGKGVSVPLELVRGLAATASARAGVSARHRDLSLLLGRALETGQATLGPGEIRALCAVLEEEHPDRLGPAAAELLRSLPAFGRSQTR